MRLEKLQIKQFRNYLIKEEKSRVTVEKYTRDVTKLYEFAMGTTEISKEHIMAFKEKMTKNYKATSVNSILAAVNQFMAFHGWNELKVKQLKIQRRPYCKEEKELTKAEYQELIRTAELGGNRRLSLLVQTICATGIRVSEISYITTDAVRRGEAEVRCKGKSRVIMIPGKLKKVLKKYMKKQNIRNGQIFITKNGRSLNRSNIWRDIKSLCRKAGVNPDKGFPHNLRHLFARTFYNLRKDLVKLADILGHSQIETTRIYTISTGAEHKKQINATGSGDRDLDFSAYKKLHNLRYVVIDVAGIKNYVLKIENLFFLKAAKRWF